MSNGQERDSMVPPPFFERRWMVLETGGTVYLLIWIVMYRILLLCYVSLMLRYIMCVLCVVSVISVCCLVMLYGVQYYIVLHYIV